MRRAKSQSTRRNCRSARRQGRRRRQRLILSDSYCPLGGRCRRRPLQETRPHFWGVWRARHEERNDGEEEEKEEEDGEGKANNAC